VIVTERGSDRFARALAGERVVPPVRGITFVDPALLPGPGGAARLPDVALARACTDLRLDFAFVPSWEPWAVDAVRALHAAGVAALWVVPGVWWPALEILGVEQALRLSVREPAALAAELELLVPTAMSAASRGLEAGAGALIVADDLAGDAGPFAGPALLATEVFPRLARIAEVATRLGAPALLHCDGDARSLFPLVREAGFAAVHGDCGGSARVEEALRAARAERVALVGGVPTSDLTSPARGMLAGAVAATLAEGGGLLVADDGGLSTAEQVEALFAALGAVLRA
jgi:uroporphyrinogen decarboxylase-like protein